MALTKTQLTIGGIAIAALAVALVVQNGLQKSLRRENETLQQKVAKLSADNQSLADKISISPHIPHLPAPAIQVSDSSGSGVDTPTLYSRLKDKDLKLKAAQLEAYLAANGRSAASLLAAYRTTSDPALLSEAMRNFPDNPEVAFEAATRKDVSPDEQRHWLDVLKKSAPDNALANYLSALDDFKTAQTDQAVKEFTAAAGKHFEDYSSQRYQNDTEAYLAAGSSVPDAKFAAGTGLTLPQLQMIKDAGLDMIELAKSYQQTGDSASAQAAMQMAISLGQRYGTSSPGEPVLSQLVGLSIEMRALNAMDPNAAYGNNGQTVQDQLSQIKQQHDSLRQQSEQVNALLPSMSEQEWAIYNDRWLTLGEQNAYQWVINRYGRNAANP